jgi:sarcosine oxidase
MDLLRRMKAKPHVAVIGAGAFGGWTALRVLERGARVTLLDAWGPGNSRSSSGGETRIMRGTYGPDQPYTGMAARALKLWEKYERRWKKQFLHRCGVLWMVGARDDSFERGSIEMLLRAKIRHRELSAKEMRKRWPQINFEGIQWGIFEPECGYLDARASCVATVAAFVAQGGEYRQMEVLADGLETGPSRKLALSDGSRVKADCFVFACGPWLGKLFPSAIGDLLQVTKQDVFFFGTPAGEDRFSDSKLPVWADHHFGDHDFGDHHPGDRDGRFLYGIPGSDSRGFKIADDTRGPVFDPTNGERIVSQETLNRVREYVAFRFPALKDAPLIESRVCQYEQTLDAHFIMDRHPAMENVWLIGGGSGHGFKHGPAIGEMMADLILNEGEPDAIWQLERFSKAVTI